MEKFYGVGGGERLPLRSEINPSSDVQTLVLNKNLSTCPSSAVDEVCFTLLWILEFIV